MLARATSANAPPRRAARAELELRVRRGELLDRRQGLDTLFRFGRMLRDRWQAWPVKVGPLLAAQFGLDPGAVIVVLEGRLDSEQRARLLEVAERCPVQRTR